MHLFHGSRFTGLTEIRPRLSTHGKAVYAAAEWLLAFYFAGSRCASGARHIRMASDGVCEFVGSQETIDMWFTRGRSVSIYTILASDFTEATQWDWELISRQPVDVISEETIDDWSDMLHDLVVDGKIRVVCQS